jgi:hypothetical protein
MTCDNFKTMQPTTTISIKNNCGMNNDFRVPISLEIVISSHSSLEEWVDVFKTILTHQTFPSDAINSIFNDDI